MTTTLAWGGARSDRHTTRHADQVGPPQAVTVGPTQAVRTTADRIGRLVSLDVRQDKATGDVFVASIKATFTAKAAVEPTFVGDDLEEGDDDE